MMRKSWGHVLLDRIVAVDKGSICVPFLPARSRQWFLIALVLLLPVLSQAQFDYTTSDGAVTITRYTGAGGDVVIPSTIDGLPVARIGENAFAFHDTLTGVTMPESVTAIGYDAFSGCSRLASITVPPTVDAGT